MFCGLKTKMVKWNKGQNGNIADNKFNLSVVLMTNHAFDYFAKSLVCDFVIKVGFYYIKTK